MRCLQPIADREPRQPTSLPNGRTGTTHLVCRREPVDVAVNRDDGWPLHGTAHGRHVRRLGALATDIASLGFEPPADQLGLVEADHRLGERIVVGVAAGSDRGDSTGVGEALGVADREVLAASVAVVHEPVEVTVAAPDRHLKRVDRKVGAERP